MKAYKPKWMKYNKKGKVRLSKLGGKYQESRLESVVEDAPEPPPIVERKPRLIKRTQ